MSNKRHSYNIMVTYLERLHGNSTCQRVATIGRTMLSRLDGQHDLIVGQNCRYLQEKKNIKAFMDKDTMLSCNLCGFKHHKLPCLEKFTSTDIYLQLLFNTCFLPPPSLTVCYFSHIALARLAYIFVLFLFSFY